MKKLLLLLLFLPLLATAQTEAERRISELEAQLKTLQNERDSIWILLADWKLGQVQKDILDKGLPKVEEDEDLIVHSAMALVYSEEHEQAKWVSHIIMPDIEFGTVGRTNDFRPDPLVRTGTAAKEDYWHSGYDRGHLAPSADFKWSQQALSESYFYSNMSPQRPSFNRKSWAKLEDRLRQYVVHNKEALYVVTGPVLTADLPKMDNEGHLNEVSIPVWYYKVVADLDGKETKGIAYLMKNDINDHPLVSYVVSIDSIETLTGIDFFSALSLEQQAELESDDDYRKWDNEDSPTAGEVAPMKPPLPKGMFNTVQAKYHNGKNITVCGTVVGTHLTKKGALYINMDRNYPEQLFYATIWDHNAMNFGYDPQKDLVNKKVCVSGKVTMYDGVARVSVNNENELQFWDDIQKK